MANAIDFLFVILTKIAQFLVTPPISVFFGILLLCFAIKIIKIIIS